LKIKQPVLVVIIVVLLAFILGQYLANSPDQASVQESRLDSILKKGKIRCSYLIYSPYFQKGANTGKLSGIFYEIMQEIGRASDLEIEWVEEVGYESIFTGVNTGRHDVFAGGLWPSASRARAGGFTIPVFYSIIKAWGRMDETRFQGLEGIDNSNVRIATIDGAMEDIIAKADYPLAHRVSLPQLSLFTQNLLNITSKKADLTFAEPGIIKEYLQTNPGTLKELAPNKPLRIFGNSIVVPLGEYELKAFLDIALKELLFNGKIDQILSKYESAPGVFPRVAVPYKPETAILTMNSDK
jgi:ABC-type amino acid transport substrate-binding protein